MGKIIWAIDPFDSTPAPGSHERRAHDAAIEVLRGVSDRTASVVEPVYVLSPGQLNLSVEFGSPMIQYYQPAAERALEAAIKYAGIRRLLTPKVLADNHYSTHQAVDALVSHARTSGADFIFVKSHGRTGISRFLLGSFTETLLLRSNISVLVSGPECTGFGTTGKGLFPTEFDHDSRKAFRKVVGLARTFKSQLTLFHAIPHPIEPVFHSGVYLLGGSWVPVQAYFDTEVDRQKKRATRWAHWAKNNGVQTEPIVETAGRQVSDWILDIAKRDHLDWIAMEALSGPISAALLGSVTRQVMRHAPCPVWIIRPRATQDESEALAA